MILACVCLYLKTCAIKEWKIRRDNGFCRCETWNQKSHLLGFYKGLLTIFEVRTQEVDWWRREGTLLKNIISKFNRIPEGSRGSYFPWFPRHTRLLDNKNLGIEYSKSPPVRATLRNSGTHTSQENQPNWRTDMDWKRVGYNSDTSTDNSHHVQAFGDCGIYWLLGIPLFLQLEQAVYDYGLPLSIDTRQKIILKKSIWSIAVSWWSHGIASCTMPGLCIAVSTV